MDILTKIINKTLANETHQHIKKIMQYKKVRFIPEIQGWLNIFKKSVNIFHYIDTLRKTIGVSQEMQKRKRGKKEKSVSYVDWKRRQILCLVIDNVTVYNESTK